MIHATEQLDVHDTLIDSRSHQLLHPERHLWTPRQLRDLTGHVTAEFAAPLSALVRYEPAQRWWARLGLTTGVELWLLSWLPGQHTEPHDHGGSAGSFTVLTGTLHECYRYPGGLIRSTIRRSRTPIGFGAGHAHQVSNRGGEPAASVHAYSLPLVPTCRYASLDDIPAEIPPLPADRTPLAELLEQIDNEVL